MALAGGQHLATYANNTTYFIHSDWLGTERARTSVSGTSFETCTSLAFGDGLTCSGADPSPMHFTGKQRDSETDLDDFGARYYASSAGRFLSADWSSVPVPVPYANLTNPQTLNLYAIVADDPTTFADLDGHIGAPVSPSAGLDEFRLCDAGFCEGIPSSFGGVETSAEAQQNNQTAANQEQRQVQNTTYTATILGRDVSVTITGGTSDDRSTIRSRLDAAIGDINAHANDLSASEKDTIHNVKSITVDDTKRTGTNTTNGTYNLKPGYVNNPGSTTAWLASTVAHEGFHVAQHKNGEVYNQQTAPRLEREANNFQIGVGAKFGLTQSQINYIRNDTHTFYNTTPY